MRGYIITAEGTRFVEEGAARRRRAKIIAVICLIIATPFMVAAAVGIYLGATEGFPTPTMREGDTMIVPTNCWVETTADAETLIIDCD